MPEGSAAVLGAVTISVLLLAPSAASAWAPAETAPIHPGVMTFTDGAQCTSNFIFQDGSNVYIGQAAHCSGAGAATETNGCETESLPIGTPVEVDGATQPGTLAYNSWITMQQKGEADEETCAFNDFALIKLDPPDVPNVNPSVPAFGGPTGVGAWGDTGSTVYTYGNSSLRGGVSALSPKQGVIVQHSPDGWSHDVYTFTPGIPGDSGSGFRPPAAGRSACSARCSSRRSPARTGSGTFPRSSPTRRRTASRGGPRPGHRAVEPRRRWGRSEGPRRQALIQGDRMQPRRPGPRPRPFRFGCRA